MSVQPLQPRLVQACLAWRALLACLAQLTTCQLAALTATRWQPVQPWLVQSRLAWQALRVRIAQLAV